MTTSKPLYAIQFNVLEDFQSNLETFKNELKKCEQDSIVLAPEVCLSGFCYDRMEEAAAFSETVLSELETLSSHRTFALSLIENAENGYINNFRIFQNGQCIRQQPKYKLFPLGDEHEHFVPGEEKIEIFDLCGIKCAVLVCFEIRFTELWLKARGAELLLVPAQWGKVRKSQFEAITKSLAILNQAYVLCANGLGESSGGSGIISPFGDEIRDDSRQCVKGVFELTEVRKMRRYIDIGLS